MARGEDCEDDIPLFSNFFQDYKKPGWWWKAWAGQGRAWRKAPLSSLPVGPQHSLPSQTRPVDSYDPLFWPNVTFLSLNISNNRAKFANFLENIILKGFMRASICLTIDRILISGISVGLVLCWHLILLMISIFSRHFPKYTIKEAHVILIEFQCENRIGQTNG